MKMAFHLQVEAMLFTQVWEYVAFVWHMRNYGYFFLLIYFFLAHLAKGHVSFCHHLASVCPSVRPSVVRRKLSHFKLLLRNHWANCNQTLVEWSLDSPLLKMCPMIPTSNQDGHQAKNRKKGGWNFNCPLLL